MTIRTLSLQQLKRSAENSAAMKHHVDDGATVLAEPRTSSAPGNMTGYSVQVQDHGPIADGTLHTLAERYATLSAAQVDYPFVTSLAESICDSAEQPAMVKADITTTTGTLGQIWGEQSTASGQWRATYYGTPAAGNTFVITTRA
ncbi:hypothetical protein [Achromobacter aegrifaciens]|uniref:hypothetical protein n=1 Tax=Achromobacter aegrifaciens TaxID=1287736 RepID=UPI001581EEF2|nr:hypothetical protein [Achromobacter aegrifaciens]